MLSPRKRRLCFILLVLASLSLALGLSLYALRQKVNLYKTPQQVLASPPNLNMVFRLGGMVVKGSVQHGENLEVNFTLTDFQAQVPVQYQGILPSLFREGQGIVAQGRLNKKGVFIADEVLAKHDANYKPPGIPNVEQKALSSISPPSISPPPSRGRVRVGVENSRPDSTPTPTLPLKGGGSKISGEH